MDKTTVAAITILLILVAVAASLAVHYFYIQPEEETGELGVEHESPPVSSHANESTGEKPPNQPLINISSPQSINMPILQEMGELRTITLLDNAGRNITVTVPVQRIVVLNNGLTEMLCALGAQNKIIGRDATSTMPPSIRSVPVVAENSYQPNVEVILELKPDIIFADSMLVYNKVAMQQLESAGVPIFISDPTDPTPTPRSNITVVDFTCSLLMKMAVIVGGEEKAEEYTQFAQHYNNLVKQRLANLPDCKRPKVMWEWYRPYYTFISPAIYHAGGVNIAENMTVYAPIMSPEFVVEQNPQVIIRMISSPSHDLKEFKELWNEIMNRPELQNVDAIKKGRVYICDWKLRNGICSVVGYLYFAKWVQPELFEDVDPAKVMAEIYQRFFGVHVEGTFVYP
ncbi:MAG: ABC transporter substrate-binding protein [Candidatus Bathyarchaeota archaeon]|nr:ABC transporter substrate-binding protein [Candidatus Bathyarchaeota archaeon]MCX8177145.1 ABC transporter substrate-binding protein [Candidatus Bathyarchaeota archaeon]MDW8193685.1 ABC transporter substrate-binding protein [Nitrososphaerota archaeon]